MIEKGRNAEEYARRLLKHFGLNKNCSVLTMAGRLLEQYRYVRNHHVRADEGDDWTREVIRQIAAGH